MAHATRPSLPVDKRRRREGTNVFMRPNPPGGLIGLEITVLKEYAKTVIATSYRYIVQRVGVRSGHPIVEGTRIGVHDVVAMVQTGASVDEVVASFPRLTRAQVYECLAYYEDHKAALDPLIAEQTAKLDE